MHAQFLLNFEDTQQQIILDDSIPPLDDEVYDLYDLVKQRRFEDKTHQIGLFGKNKPPETRVFVCPKDIGSYRLIGFFQYDQTW